MSKTVLTEIESLKMLYDYLEKEQRKIKDEINLIKIRQERLMQKLT